MPITVIPAPPGTSVSPGAPVTLVTDFIGPFPTGTNWVLNIAEDPEGLNSIAFSTKSFLTSTDSLTFQTPNFPASTTPRASVAPGANVHVLAQLVEPGNVVVDSGAITAVWQPTANVGTIVQEWAQTQTGGGLTAEQAAQLEQTNAQTFLSHAIDALTLTEVTTGPSSGPVEVDLAQMAFGLIVRIFDVPEDLVPDTPDGGYWLPSLAVVRLFRGSDLWLRVPIHTETKIIPFANENLVVAAAELTLTQWALNLHATVYFRTGVTGQVYIMRFP